LATDLRDQRVFNLGSPAFRHALEHGGALLMGSTASISGAFYATVQVLRTLCARP
jgi:hypothetical protein